MVQECLVMIETSLLSMTLETHNGPYAFHEKPYRLNLKRRVLFPLSHDT
jgi:hypothetical protein